MVTAAVAYWGAVFLGCAPAPSSSPGPAADLAQAGVARIDITPEEPIRLSGYGSRREPAAGVDHPLWAKALALGSDAAGPVVLITTDLIGIPGAIADTVAERLQARVGLTRARVALLATHTHGGPFVLGAIPNLFGEDIPPEHLAVVARYTRSLTDRLERVAMDALAARSPARIAWGRGAVSTCVNRRVIENGKWVATGVNPEGPFDPDLPVMSVTAPDGGLRAVFLSYACHATTLGGAHNRVHPDWPGAVQSMLERAHPGAVALVAIGAGADANPHPRGQPEHVRRHAEAIVAEVERVLGAPMRTLPTRVQASYERIRLPFHRVPDAAEWVAAAKEPGATGYRARAMLDRLVRGEPIPASLGYPVQAWTFGDELAMVFLGGEVVSEYGLRLKRELDPERVWVNAYANDIVGYIASRRMMPEGGYEVESSMRVYDHPGRLADDAEDRIINAVHRLLPWPARQRRPARPGE